MTGRRKQGPVLQPRDLHLLRELETMRVIDREQAKTAAGFGSTTRVNARLLKLSRAGLLRRVFVGTIAGGRKALYALSTKGAALIGAAPGPALKQGSHLAGNRALEHQLAVNQIYLAVKHGELPEGVHFLRWVRFVEPLTATVPLVPDGCFEVEAPDRRRLMFVEADLASESLKVWKEKARQYVRLAVSGEFARIFRRDRFLTLAIASTDRRLENLRSATAEITGKIFRFSTFERIKRSGFWSPVWLRPIDDRELPLLGD